MRHKPIPQAPPTVAELAFQTYQFDSRIQRRTAGLENLLCGNVLGASFFSTHGRDRSITSQFADKLAAAGEILKSPVE